MGLMIADFRYMTPAPGWKAFLMCIDGDEEHVYEVPVLGWVPCHDEHHKPTEFDWLELCVVEQEGTNYTPTTLEEANLNAVGYKYFALSPGEILDQERTNAIRQQIIESDAKKTKVKQ